MARLALLLSLGVILSPVPNALAGPACAKKNFKAADCVARCQSKWGWTGAMMNPDPWGPVVKKTDTVNNWDTVISEACGFPAAASTASTTPTPSLAPPTVNVITVPGVLDTTASAVSSTTPITSSTVLPASIAAFFSSASASLLSSSVIATSSAAPKPSVLTFGFLASAKPVAAAPPPTPTKPVQQPVFTTHGTKESQPTPPAVSTPPSTNNGGTSNADIQAYLAGHNTIRSQHGANGLTWNDNLASKAQEWANKCVFQHSGGSLGPFGENLAAGTGSSYGIAAAIKSWTDEVSQYNANSPVPSHFTQVVWKGTSEVGCAVSSCSGIFAASFGPAKFFVCEYSSQGNIIGQFPQNVQV